LFPFSGVDIQALPPRYLAEQLLSCRPNFREIGEGRIIDPAAIWWRNILAARAF
jgi:hypothetical protein